MFASDFIGCQCGLSLSWWKYQCKLFPLLSNAHINNSLAVTLNLTCELHRSKISGFTQYPSLFALNRQQYHSISCGIFIIFLKLVNLCDHKAEINYGRQETIQRATKVKNIQFYVKVVLFYTSESRTINDLATGFHQ